MILYGHLYIDIRLYIDQSSGGCTIPFFEYMDNEILKILF